MHDDLVNKLRYLADEFSESRNKKLQKHSELLRQAASRLLDLGEELSNERAECDLQAAIVARLLKERREAEEQWPGVQTK